METIDLQSSSEEDEDIYLNSVAKLKALKKQASLQCSKEKTEDKKDEEIEITEVPEEAQRITRNRSNKNISCPQTRSQKQRHNENNRNTQTSSRRRTRNQKRKSIPQEQDSDLEIISVEERKNSLENDDSLITETNVESNEDEDYDINIKILWRSKTIHRLDMRQNENFRQIFEYFANLEQVSVDEILIIKGDRIIKTSDTPTSINLSVIDILEGGIIKRDNTLSRKNVEENVDEDACAIKVQTTNKKSLTISVRQDEDFKVLLTKCAQEFNTEESKIKLYFDGELIKITDTPNSLEIEDEACFDLRISL